MLTLTFIAGCLSVLPVWIYDQVVKTVFDFRGPFYDAFITAAIPEECCKLLMFFIFIWPSKYFDEYFDGIVYFTFISLGFACVENFIYVFDINGGVSTGIVRAVFSVPGHFLFGVLGGYYLALAKFKSSKKIADFICAVIVPVSAHGIFNYLLFKSEELSDLKKTALLSGFVAFDIVLWIEGSKRLKKLQKRNEEIDEYSL